MIYVWIPHFTIVCLEYKMCLRNINKSEITKVPQSWGWELNFRRQWEYHRILRKFVHRLLWTWWQKCTNFYYVVTVPFVYLLCTSDITPIIYTSTKLHHIQFLQKLLLNLRCGIWKFGNVAIRKNMYFILKKKQRIKPRTHCCHISSSRPVFEKQFTSVS